MRIQTLAFLTISILLSPISHSAEPSGCTLLDSVATVPAVDFEQQIQPIFDAQCNFCHQPSSSGDLNLTAGNAWSSLVGQESTRSPGELLVDPYFPERSVLFRAINCDNPVAPFFRMGALSDSEQGLIRDWIVQGAHPQPSIPAIPADLGLTEVAAAGTFAQALGLTNASDGSGRLFVIRQSGQIETVSSDGTIADFMSLPGPLVTGGERGLLGLAFHPDFGTNGRFFVNYTAGSGHPAGTDAGDTVISEFQIDGSTGRGDPDSERVLMTITQDFTNHNGGQIKFGPDGYLYIGMGDGGSGGDPCNRSQTLSPADIVTGGSCKSHPSTALLGKMLRIDVDRTTPAGTNSLCAASDDGSAPYAVPADNPYVQSGGCGETWAVGLRNPWRWSFDRRTGDLWVGDVGQNRWEEISWLEADSPAGANFGWKLCEGPYTYPAQEPPQICSFDHQAPVLFYTTSGQPECSITGGYRYRGPVSALDGVYVYGDYCSGQIWLAWQTDANAFEALPFTAAGFDLRSFGEDESGNLYIVRSGGVWRLELQSLFSDRFEALQ
jgi:glucose/arabinose dehydrogenase